MKDTRGEDYTRRLSQLADAPWKRLLDVQAPYRWNLRRYDLGVTLDVGCGVGRNLASLPTGSVGVDHNISSVAAARSHGLTAMTVTEWQSVAHERAETFDSLLIAHVIEHVARDEATALVMQYLPALRPGGKVLMICPQERGYASDPTHVSWTTETDLVNVAYACGLVPGRWRSFPLPRWAGRWFTYNEFTLLAVKPLPPARSHM